MQHFNTFFPECRLCPYCKVVSSFSGSGQSQATKFISCIFEAKFFVSIIDINICRRRRGNGAKKVFGMLERKEELLMTTNSLSLKKSCANWKGFRATSRPKPEAWVLACGLRLTGVTAVCTKCNRRVFQYISVYRTGKSREQSTVTEKFLGHTCIGL